MVLRISTQMGSATRWACDSKGIRNRAPASAGFETERNGVCLDPTRKSACKVRKQSPHATSACNARRRPSRGFLIWQVWAEQGSPQLVYPNLAGMG
jgi:hypothetical protein